MKTERRHELQTNELADWLGHSYQSAKPFSKTILAVVVAVVVIAGTAWFLLTWSNAKRGEAWQEYQVAFSSDDPDSHLRTLLEEHPNTPAGQAAKIYFADSALESGINLQFTDRAEAQEKLEEALADYEEVAENAREPVLEERATLGAAKANEALMRLDGARALYEKVVQDFPNSLSAQMATDRLEDLNRKSTQEFYSWFAQFEPPTPATGPGTPGVKPDFDALPDTPDAPLGPGLGLPSVGAEKLPSGAMPEKPAANASDAPTAEKTGDAPETPAEPESKVAPEGTPEPKGTPEPEGTVEPKTETPIETPAPSAEDEKSDQPSENETPAEPDAPPAAENK